MFIAILVLLGIAGAIWYFARQQTQTVNLSHGDVTASNPSFEETEVKLKEAQQAALEVNSRLEKMTQKIDEALATATTELPSQKVKAEIAQEEVVETPVVEPTPVAEEAPVTETAVEETYEITEEEFQSEVSAGSTEVVSEEVGDSKPVRKKKRRYYPKKK